jgi:adenosylmethionine---8-amino-7-oxononanoate aminotransferase
MQSSSISDRIWLPFTSWQDSIDFPPLVISRAAGIHLYDRDGTSYIDATGSWWVSLFGHNHPHITEAVKEQLNRLEHVMMAGCIAEPTIRLASLLSEMLPAKLEKMFFSDNGSTSVEVAMKIALQYHRQTGNTQRQQFIGLGGGYHGDTLGAMSVGNIPQYHAMFHETFKKGLFTDPPYCYRCPCGQEPGSCTAQCMDSLEVLLEEHGGNTAAVIFEPMAQGAAGMHIYPPIVLKRIFKLCERYNVLTIADEVAMGFGRTGRLFACEHAGVVPDIMCLAKGLTAGFLPLAITAVTGTIFDAFKGDALSGRTFEHGHTFTGNALACAAGCAALELMQQLAIPDSTAGLSRELSRHLQTFTRYDIVGDIRALGTVGAMELVADRKSKKRLDPVKKIPFFICRNALKHGVLLRPLGDVIYFMLPYITATDQLDRIMAATHNAFTETLDAIDTAS